MIGAHKRFDEVSRLLAGDPLGGKLSDDLLNACFDLVLDDKGEQDSTKALARLMATLERFNTHLRRDRNLPGEGLFVGSPEEVASWAESLTWQIWENRPD
ncbi:MAG: hypothetical protein ED859_16865 [Desulfuromonadales bacterium]|nr:MAG: hypothetical protein ED859_16865 [Desulfuromonadales bacterium]